MILNDSVKKTWPTFYEMGMCKVFIVNYESLKKYFVLDIVKNEKGKFKLSNVKFNSNINIFESVAIDELHKIKDPTTMVSKLVRGVCAKKKVVIGLTGTPIVNKPKDLVAQLLAIGQLEAVAGNYKHFMNRYCGGMAGAGATNLEELNYKLKTTCFFQRLKKDVLKDLPDKVHQIVYCDITTRDEYNKASTDLANYLKENKDKTDAEVAKSMRGEVMVKIGILKQISARGKMNEVSEYIEEIVDADEKVGVFLHHKEIANFVKEKFPSTLLYTGSQSDEEKNKAVHDFQKCKKCDIRFENHVNCDHEHVPSNNKIIALSTKAGGVGLTLTAASRMAVIELPWHPADCEQIESRFHRMSQKNSVQCTYFLGKDTIDEHIYDIIEKKRAIADTVLGVSDDRKFVDDFIKDYNDGKIKL
jgi:SWI/SNF-related matrix-associated actin-dependent regulator 1 of chromatin subfamily A